MHRRPRVLTPCEALDKRINVVEFQIIYSDPLFYKNVSRASSVSQTIEIGLCSMLEEDPTIRYKAESTLISWSFTSKPDVIPTTHD